MGDERREFGRISQAFEVRYRVYGEFGETWTNAMSVNLSAGGMRIQSREPIVEGARVEIDVNLPHVGGRLILRGRIVWTQLKAVGVVEHGLIFEDVSPEQAASVDSLVRFLGRSSTPPS